MTTEMILGILYIVGVLASVGIAAGYNRGLVSTRTPHIIFWSALWPIFWIYAICYAFGLYCRNQHGGEK